MGLAHLKSDRYYLSMTQKPRVPIALRETIFLICSKRPFSYFGKACYSLISRIVANKLKRFSDSAEIYLRGKEATKSTPGVSDLDFWIFLSKPELQKPETLIRLRILFRKLSKRFLLPVKLEVTSRDGWELSQRISPASFLQDIPLIKFTSLGWSKQNTIAQLTPRALSRFNLCFFEYKSAQSCLNKLAENTAYHHAVFRKHIRKLIEFAAIDLHSTRGSILQLQAYAIIVLDRLSATAIQEVNNVSDLQIKVLSDRTECTHFSKYALVNHFAEFAVEYDQVLDLLIWKVDQPDLKSAEQVFSIFEKIPKDERPKFIVTQRVWKCLWHGPALGALLENLGSIPREIYKNEETLASALYLQVRDRLVTRINHNLGVLVSYNQSEFMAPMLYQCFEILIIHTRQLTSDLNLLCSIAESDCPLTVKWFRRLKSKKIPSSLQEWSEAFIEIRREALKVAHNSIKF